MAAHLAILWSTVLEGELAVIEQVAQEQKAQATPVDMRSLGARVFPLLAQGAVIVIAGSDRDASLALSVGVDEVLRAGEVTAVKLTSVVERAIVRASARAKRESSRRGLEAENQSAFRLLTAALGNELGAPLMVASTNCEVLSSGLATVLGVTDELVNWATLSAPLEQLRNLVAVRCAAPSTNDLHEILDDTRSSLDRAVALMKTLRELSFDAGQRVVDVDAMLRELVELVRGYVSYWADLELEVSESCVAALSRSSFTCLVSSLLASSLDAVRERGIKRGSIRLRAAPHEDCLLLEIHHNGRPMRTDLRPDVLEGRFGESAPLFDSELVAARESAREHGGDLLVDSDASGTTLRLILPAAPRHQALTSLPDGWDESTVDRPPVE